MHRFSRMHLSPEVALQRLDAIDLEEKSKTAEGISLIAVIDHRRDYLAAGYSSMFGYCTERLHMSEDRAVRRIEVARVALKIPEVLDYLADGRLSVTTACVLAPHLTPETADGLLTAASFRSRQEIVRLLSGRSRPAADETLALDGPTHVEDSSGLSAPVRINAPAEPYASRESASIAGPLAPVQVNPPHRGQVRPSASGDYDVRLTLTAEEHADLRRAQDLLGHSVPSGDPALIYARAVKHYVAHLEKQRIGAKRGDANSASPAPPRMKSSLRGHRIPNALRRFIWQRDGGRCTFVGANGHRCEATWRVEIDHVVPVAQGGSASPENLRLLCRAHNQFEAERVLGKEHVQRKCEPAQRHRARAKAAEAAAAARANARGDAGQARYDDLEAALRGLGFTGPEARRGAESADAKPGAPLEACLRLALAELTRAVVIRGERRAKCSA